MPLALQFRARVRIRIRIRISVNVTGYVATIDVIGLARNVLVVEGGALL